MQSLELRTKNSEAVKVRKKVGFGFLACSMLVNSFSIFAYSQGDAHLLDLSELIAEARERNPEILAAKKRYEASKARIPQAKSLDDPILTFEFEKIPRSTFQLNNTMPDDRMLSVQQMFPFLGKLPLKGKIALVESQMFAAEYKDRELEVIKSVKNAYYDLFINYKEIELSKQSLVFLEAIANISVSKYTVGDMAQEDVFKIQLEIARLTSDIANLEQENKAKQALLTALLHREPESPLGIPYLSEDLSFEGDSKQLYQLTLLNQPDLIIASYAVEKNKYAKSLAKRSFFPDLMAALTQRGIASGMYGPWDLMLAFSLPLWFWTKQRYEVKEAIANVEEAEAAYEAMKDKAFAHTKEMYTKIEIAKNKVHLYKANVLPLLENSLASSMAAFQSGMGDFMMLLDTQRMLLETKMEYYEALVEYNMNVAELERAIGVGLKEVKKL